MPQSQRSLHVHSRFAWSGSMVYGRIPSTRAPFARWNANSKRRSLRSDNASTDEVIADCRRYAEILGGTLELDVRTFEEALG